MGQQIDRDSNVSSILDKCATVLEVRGWQSGGGWWYGPNSCSATRGSLCAEGALQLVLDMPHKDHQYYKRDDFVMHPAYQAMQAYLGTVEPLHAWNDHYVRNQYEAVTAFRRAADLARQVEKEAEQHNRKNKLRMAFKALANAMNKEMEEFEREVQTEVPAKEKELVSL